MFSPAPLTALCPSSLSHWTTLQCSGSHPIPSLILRQLPSLSLFMESSLPIPDHPQEKVQASALSVQYSHHLASFHSILFFPVLCQELHRDLAFHGSLYRKCPASCQTPPSSSPTCPLGQFKFNLVSRWTDKTLQNLQDTIHKMLGEKIMFDHLQHFYYNNI